MGKPRFVDPEVVRLPLSDGDFIDVKRQLTYGEQEDLLRATRRLFPDGAERFDSAGFRTAEVVTYLVGWSFTRKDGAPVPMSPDLPLNTRLDTIKALPAYEFEEVYDALKQHVKAVEAERAKNGQSTAIASEVNSGFAVQ